MIWENTGSFTKECQVSEEIRSYISVKVADMSPKVQNPSASKLKRSDALSDSRFKNQAKDDGSRFNTKSRKPHVEDVQMLALGGRVIDEMSDVDLSTPAPENCQLVITDCGNEKPEQLDLPNSCYVGDQVFQENKLHLNVVCWMDSVFSLKNPSRKMFFNVLIQKNQKELVPAEVNQKFPEPFSLIPHGMLDFSSNVAEILESQNVDDAVSENNETAVESYNLDSQSRNDFQLHCQDCSLKLDSVGDFTSKLNVKVQVEGGSAIKDIIEPKDRNQRLQLTC